ELLHFLLGSCGCGGGGAGLVAGPVCAFIFSPFPLSEAEAEYAWRPRQHCSGHVTWTLLGEKNARRRERLPEVGQGLQSQQGPAFLVHRKSLKQRRKVTDTMQ